MCMLYITISSVLICIDKSPPKKKSSVAKKKNIRLFSFQLSDVSSFSFSATSGSSQWQSSDMGFFYEHGGHWVPLTIKGGPIIGGPLNHPWYLGPTSDTPRERTIPLISWSCPSASSPSFLSFGSCHASPSFPAKKKQFKPVKTFKHQYTCLFNETGMIVATQIALNHNNAANIF